MVTPPWTGPAKASCACSPLQKTIPSKRRSSSGKWALWVGVCECECVLFYCWFPVLRFIFSWIDLNSLFAKAHFFLTFNHILPGSRSCAWRMTTTSRSSWWATRLTWTSAGKWERRMPRTVLASGGCHTLKPQPRREPMLIRWEKRKRLVHRRARRRETERGFSCWARLFLRENNKMAF